MPGATAVTDACKRLRCSVAHSFALRRSKRRAGCLCPSLAIFV